MATLGEQTRPQVTHPPPLPFMTDSTPCGHAVCVSEFSYLLSFLVLHT